MGWQCLVFSRDFPFVFCPTTSVVLFVILLIFVLLHRIASLFFSPSPFFPRRGRYFVAIFSPNALFLPYPWSEAIAADMAKVFEKSPKGFFDQQAGLRLRREIYETGNSRDVNESIAKFLGRPQSIKPFLKELGVGTF